MRWFLFFSVLLICLTGCADDGADSDPPTVDISGTWAGSWQSGNGCDGGTITFMSLLQEGAEVTGEAIVSNACIYGGALEGIVSGNTFSGSATSGSVHLSFESTVTGNRIHGTYHTPKSGPCIEDSGSFTLKKSGSE